ncbi:MAG: hypothetical protein O7G87_05720 [bacterium]|nr:hypothetical protein [bacterium]
MNRIILIVMCLCSLIVTPQVEAFDLFSFKVGGGYIPEGSLPGGIVKADIGPLSPFAEFFRKNSTTTVNIGANILLIKVSAPILKPYLGAGGGISRSSGGGRSKVRSLITGIAGADLKLTESLHVFGQAKYLYTHGSGRFMIREVALQGGLVFGIGL